jgi:hypothetical protein
MWQPWANNAESFERAVFADLERRVSKPVAAYLMREPAGRGLREARLDGSYPKTAIVVSFLNLHTGSVEESLNSLPSGSAITIQVTSSG